MTSYWNTTVDRLEICENDRRFHNSYVSGDDNLGDNLIWQLMESKSALSNSSWEFRALEMARVWGLGFKVDRFGILAGFWTGMLEHIQLETDSISLS